MIKTLTLDTYLGEALKYESQQVKDNQDLLNQAAETRMKHTLDRLKAQGYTVIANYVHEALGTTFELETPATLTFDMTKVPEKYLEEFISKLNSDYNWNANGGRERYEAEKLLNDQLLVWAREKVKEAKLLNISVSNTSYSCFEASLWLPKKGKNLGVNIPYTIRSNEFKTAEDFTFYVTDTSLWYDQNNGGIRIEGASSIVGHYKTFEEMFADLQLKGYELPFSHIIV